MWICENCETKCHSSEKYCPKCEAERPAGAIFVSGDDNRWMTFGVIFILTGVVSIFYAFIFDTSVPINSTISIVPDTVNNIGLMQKQMMIFGLGALSFLSGIIALGVSTIKSTLGSN